MIGRFNASSTCRNGNSENNIPTALDFFLKNHSGLLSSIVILHFLGFFFLSETNTKRLM